MEELLSCPFCDGLPAIHTDTRVFLGQEYGGYPRRVATQNHGYQIRCEKCGCQTCWWHYQIEATTAWNTRKEIQPVNPADAKHSAAD